MHSIWIEPQGQAGRHADGRGRDGCGSARRRDCRAIRRDDEELLTLVGVGAILNDVGRDGMQV